MCTYSKHNDGKEPPKFTDYVLYRLRPQFQRSTESVVELFGYELNRIQPTVIYNLNTRYAPVGAAIFQEEKDEQPESV